MKQASTFGKIVDKTWKSIEAVLRKRGFNAVMLDSERALRKFIDETIPKNCIVGLGSSLTSSANKIKEILLERGNQIYYFWNGTSYNRSLDTFEEHPRPEYFLTTADSITSEGRLVNHEFSRQAILENGFPKNIIAFSDTLDINKEDLDQLYHQDYVVIDEKPRTTEVTVAVVPFSMAS